MRRVAAILALVVAATALLVSGSAAGGDQGTYEVRAIFDSAGFLVPGEEVRVAGAKAGVVADIDVTGADEPVRRNGEPEPGKAVVVMQIDDPAFQDFREDASCLIRPQSLIGEKYVECEPTQPRAPGSVPPPELAEIPEGEAGAGQRLLPLEQNGKAVDLDLVNDIMKEPYPDRFRLILNDLGAGLAARGKELAEIVERSNPALRETNQVLAILARQNRALAGLATDSDAILGALARERERVASFINEGAVVGEATAERSADLEESFARFPGFLRELRATMVDLRDFSDEATPLFAELRGAAPSLTRVSRLLEPFSNAGTDALTTLGDATEQATAPLVESDPVIRQIRDLAEDAKAPTRNLAKLLATLRKTDGFEYLFRTVLGLSGTANGFDDRGHFLRALVPVNVCFDYTSIAQAGCGARFGTTTTASARAAAVRQQAELRRLMREPDDERGDRRSPRRSGESKPLRDEPLGGLSEPDAGTGPRPEDEEMLVPEALSDPMPDAGEAGEGTPADDAASPRASMRAARDLLDFLIGERGREGAKR